MTTGSRTATKGWQLGRRWACASALACLTSVVGRAQSAAPPANTETSQLRIARRVMEQVRYCALITSDWHGRASARTIDPLPPDSAFVVHFVTNPKSRKVRELSRDRRVTLYYFDPAALAYVSLYGTARRINDSREKAKWWKSDWTPIYPNRQRDAAIYEVRPERLEIVSLRDGVTGDTVTWAPPTIKRFPAAKRP